MTYSISTSAARIAQDPISTPWQSGYTTAAWLYANKQAVVTANANGWSCGAGLVTHWESAHGTQTVETDRSPTTETDTHLIDRHFDNVANAMATEPPIH